MQSWMCKYDDSGAAKNKNEAMAHCSNVDHANKIFKFEHYRDNMIGIKKLELK